jgi:DNA-binding transcriptional LysR family regulator
MELRHLRYFVAVAEELHFSRAAKRLHIAQPPLSQQIRSLEDELGVQLLQRTKHQVQLTAAGQLFLEEARRTLAQADQAIQTVQRASRGEIGRLVIGFPTSAAYSVLPDILRAFREQSPSVELVLHELNTALQVDRLQDGSLDLGFVHPPFITDNLRSLTILKEPFVAAIPATHPLAARSQISLKALANEPFILFPRHVGPGFYDQIVSLCQNAGFSPRVVQEARLMQTIVCLVAAAMGVALVPSSLQNLQRPGVVYKPIQALTARVETAVAWRQDDPSPVLQAFLQVVKQIAEPSHLREIS